MMVVIAKTIQPYYILKIIIVVRKILTFIFYNIGDIKVLIPDPGTGRVILMKLLNVGSKISGQIIL